MKIRSIKIFVIITMMFLVLTGCTINLELGKNKEVKKQEVEPQVPKEKVETDYFNIYTANIDSYKKEIKLNKEIPRTSDKDQRINQLKAITNSLSENCFSGLPIEVIEIKNINGKDIVKINLKESKENENVLDPIKAKGQTWKWQYMQGSAGGTITTISLEETILQRDYKGEWIDGVEFLYNNNKIQQEHAPKLGNVIYR